MAYYRRAGGLLHRCRRIRADQRAARFRSGAARSPRSPEDGLRMADGTVLPADVIVYATGYRPMNEWVGKLISPDVERKVGRVWGLGSGTEGDPGPWEGELRNMWKPTAQEGLWFQGGNIMQARFHSLHLALQLKARMVGTRRRRYIVPVGRRSAIDVGNVALIDWQQKYRPPDPVDALRSILCLMVEESCTLSRPRGLHARIGVAVMV